jgi:DNA invertase Pin-like site-specific DNA recombinase
MLTPGTMVSQTYARLFVTKEDAMEGRFVAYYRVSRDSQGIDGYGMAAQRKALDDYLDGGNWKLVAEFTEVESGKRHENRPQLALALAAAKKRKATLVIAKLDRLARNVHFISGLMESKVPFVVAEMPNATPFMLHIHAAVAEEERRMIAARTRAGLAEAKERGVRLGGPKLLAINGKRQADSLARAKAMAPIMDDLRAASARAAARELNERKIPTPTGKPWSATTVIRLRERLDSNGAACLHRTGSGGLPVDCI